MKVEIPTRELLGVRFALADYEGALRRIEEMVAAGDRGYFCCTSVHGLMESDSDAELATALNGAELNLPDGMPIVWALNLLSDGKPLRDRVYGPTLMESACERAAALGHSIYLYGGYDDGALRELKTALRRRSPAIEIAGSWSPPHRELSPEEDREVAARIDESGAELVWCGISTPRQESLAGAELDAAPRARMGLPPEPRAAPPRAPLFAQQSRFRRRGRPPIRARARRERWVESRSWPVPSVRHPRERPATSGSGFPPTTSPIPSSR
jgi:exopolysaccharide biosynthesis WecB/TagA/CpsF family protein